MPKPPSWIEEVKFLWNYLENPCHAPFWILIECALEPLEHLVWAWVSIDLNNIVTSFVRPKGLRSGRHGRKSRVKIPGSGIFELDEMIGGNLPGAEQMHGRQVSNGVQHLYIIESVEERVLWYWMVVSTITDFFYEWASQIVKNDRSSCPNSIGMHRYQNGSTLLAGYGWTPAFANGLYWSKGVNQGPSFCIVDDGPWTLMVSASGFKPVTVGRNIGQVGVRLVIVGTPIVVENTFDYLEKPDGQALAVGRFNGPLQAVIEWHVDGEAYTVDHLDFIVYRGAL